MPELKPTENLTEVLTRSDRTRTGRNVQGVECHKELWTRQIITTGVATHSHRATKWPAADSCVHVHCSQQVHMPLMPTRAPFERIAGQYLGHKDTATPATLTLDKAGLCHAALHLLCILTASFVSASASARHTTSQVMMAAGTCCHYPRWSLLCVLASQLLPGCLAVVCHHHSCWCRCCTPALRLLPAVPAAASSAARPGHQTHTAAGPAHTRKSHGRTAN
jgi:hypothetical protein